jgi:hypothetical protein
LQDVVNPLVLLPRRMTAGYLQEMAHAVVMLMPPRCAPEWIRAYE